MDGRTQKLVVAPVLAAIFVFAFVLTGGFSHLPGTQAAGPGGLSYNYLPGPKVPGLPASQLRSGPANGATGAFHWSPGAAFPLVNGHAVYPPLARSVNPGQAPPPTTSRHYYVGSYFAGTATTSNWVIAEISVPTDTPSSSEFYYQVLSVWDNGGSYDQVGFADDYGVWGLAWSYTTGTCAASYVYTPDAVSLVAGQEYLLAITTENTGYITMVVWSISASAGLTEVYQEEANTGGNALEVEYSYCGDYDYTDFEEVYGIQQYQQPLPYDAPYGLSFFYHANCYGSTGCDTYADWGTWSSSAPPNTSASLTKFSGVPEILTILNKGSTKGYYTD